MNGLRLPNEILFPNDTPNVLDLRNKTYKFFQDGMKKFIDDMFSVCSIEKQEEILQRKPHNNAYMNSLFEFYKGIEIPLMDKTEFFLDGISYIPTTQIVDKPIHSQKNGKFIIVKTNMKYSMLKMDGTCGIVLTKIGICPLLIYLLYAFNNDVRTLLTELEFELTDDENEAKYFIPDFGNKSKETVFKVKECEMGRWKDFLLLPFTKENLSWHNEILDKLNEELEKQTNEEDEEIEEENEPDIIETKQSEKTTFYIDDEATKLEKMRHNNMSEREKELANEISMTICCYLANTKRAKRGIRKLYVANALHKLTIKDMTLNDISILGMITECVKNDSLLPDATDIGDLSQKMVRFLEWYVLKLLSVRSFPEQSTIMEICKVEPKLNYNNTTNVMAELSLLLRTNIFGKGGLPRESCQANVRNLHDSYFGVIDPINSSSGFFIKGPFVE